MSETSRIRRIDHLSAPAGRGRIASAIRVRGGLRKRGRNRFKNACQIAQHVVIPESQNKIIMIDKPFVADHIARVVSMLAAVNLDNEAAFSADKIDRVRTNGILPNEFVPIEPARSQPVPKAISALVAAFRKRLARSVFISLAARMLRLPLTRIASQSDLSPHTGRG